MTNKLIIFAVAVLFYSCSDNSTQNAEQKIDTNYFFLDSGFYKIYKVKTIVVDAPINIYDTSEYFIKEIQTGFFEYADDDSVMRLERMYRNNEGDEWKPLKVWSASINYIRALQTEENIKYVKILFPVEKDKEWNGNTYNREDTLSNNNYSIISVDMPLTLGDLQFDKVLTVLHEYDSSLVTKINDYEKYAYGVGLIYKQSVNLNSQDIDPGVPIEERLNTGVSQFEELIEYGYEE